MQRFDRLSLIITSIVAGISSFALSGEVGVWPWSFRFQSSKRRSHRRASPAANYVDPSFLTDSQHDFGGHSIFVLSVVILISLVWLLRKFEHRHGYYLPDGLRAKL
jgi:hypothetical protein